ncbi:MAG: hypothetical protein BIFFINMI_02649 [Phycisphaerae bacterium]|nr:hypothetical protein [Phycisphaerae bacterium]
MNSDAATGQGGGIIGSADSRWLDPARIRISADRNDRLFLTDEAGVRHEGVRVGKMFALTEPDRYVSFCTSDGEEIGLLREPAELAEDSRELLRRHLRRQYFVPVITGVREIREFWMDQTWTVLTDRGPRQFTLQGREAIRFLGKGAMLLIDTDDNRYLIEDSRKLDAASRKWIDSYVW